MRSQKNNFKMPKSRLIIYKHRNKYSVHNQKIKIQIYWNNNKKCWIYNKIQKKSKNNFKNKKMILMRLKGKKIKLKKNCF